MHRRWRRPARPMRSGLTLIELLVAIAALGLLGALVMSTRAPDSALPMACEEVMPAADPAPDPPPGELSLQATLDQLGFTVNVPSSYEGHAVRNWGSYRASTQDDSLEADQFVGSGRVTFQELCRQTSLAGVLTFGMQSAEGSSIPLLEPSPSRPGCWISRSAGRSISRELPGTVRFYLDTPAGGDGEGVGSELLLSTPVDNPNGSSPLLVLPARTGGEWVDEGENTGHWEGGSDTGAYLLCWEDRPNGGDHDYQDLVVLARGIQPIDE